MLAILAFAPPNLAIHYFEVLEKNNSPKLEFFFDYFEDNYRGCSLKLQEGRAQMLSIEMWFMFERVDTGHPRTTNTVESWHRVFQYTVGYAHPTNYKLIESIQLEQYYSRNKETTIDAGQNVLKNSKMYICLCWSTKIA